MIKFNIPSIIGNEERYIQDVLFEKRLCGDGKYTKMCQNWLENNTGAQKALLTTSCTHALELAALLLDIQPDDEIIMPSYTFVSTANAFVLRGGKVKFVDIRPDTMNIDESKIEAAITSRTKVIVPVHYAGVACDMDKIMAIAEKYNLFVVEDAAQGLMATYKGRMLGTIGHLGTYSFHETKNFVSGEGGALLINDARFNQRAEILREKGTNRAQFFRGEVDKYTWQDVGSSYLPNELTAAFLYAQLEQAHLVNEKRLELWLMYYNGLMQFHKEGYIELPSIFEGHNGHIIYFKLKNVEKRQKLISYLKEHGIQTTFHFVPLHSSPAGMKYTVFHGEDIYTTKESERLCRVPLYHDISEEQITVVLNAIENYFRKEEEHGE